MDDTKPFNYRYPLTKLTSSDDYLKITVLKYNPPGIIPEGSFALPSAGELSGYETSTPKGTIILPIPDDVQDKNSVTWGQSSLNLAEGLVTGGAAALLGGKDLVKKVKGAIDELVKTATTGSGQKTITAAAIGAGLNTLLGSDKLPDIVGRAAGVIANSNIELIFSGIKIREGFTFAFDIVPRSQKEAQQVKDIIRAFKKHSAGKKGIGEGLFLQAPEVFKLEYMSGNKRHPYLNRFKICALQGMSVNYTPGGTYATYADAAPVNITLGLNFQELTPIFAEDYDTDIGKEGTGY